MIDEKDGRWFQLSRPSRRANPFVDPDAYVTTHRARTRPRFANVRRLTDTRCYEWLRTWFVSTTQMNGVRDVHPVFKACAFAVSGMAVILLVAGAMAGVLMKGLSVPPALAAVTRPITEAITGPSAAATPVSPQPSGAADGIPAGVMTLYQQAARTCGVPWNVLAAIGRVETNHGTSNAPGVHSGANYAGAEGPMQFLPATWAKYGVDADHNGKADIYDQTDAVYSAAKYLCANGGAQASQLHNAVWHYNHSDAYVSQVMSLATSLANDAYALPVSDSVAKSVNMSGPHHDYPADDIDMPVGTQIYAVRGGTAHVTSNATCGNELRIDGTDGFTYTYCHASSVDIANNSIVGTGDPVLHSGGRAGAAGAGDSTGPHLHLQITVSGKNVCPQPLLAQWAKGQFASPASAPTTGCFN